MNPIARIILFSSILLSEAIIAIPIITFRNDIKPQTSYIPGTKIKKNYVDDHSTRISVDIDTDKAWAFLTGSGDKKDKNVNSQETRKLDLKGAVPRSVNITWNDNVIKWSQSALHATVAGWQEAIGQSEDYLFVVNRDGVTMGKKLSIQGNSYTVIGIYKWATPTKFEKSSSKQTISA